MSLSIHSLDLREAQATLAGEIRCRGATSALHTAIVADHIRTLVWAPYLRSEGADRQPVHTSRIFAALDRNLRFLAPGGIDAVCAAAHSTYEFVRDQIELCGDIVHLGNGYWIPGPLRLVRPSTTEMGLVVGGIPTGTLEKVFKRPIHSIGPARYAVGIEGVNAALAADSVAGWLGISESLADWTKQTLAWAATQLLPQADIEDDNLEIYAPDIFRLRRRPGFWLGAKEFQESAATLRLFRPRTAARWSFDRPDYLGVFRPRIAGAHLTQAVQIPRDLGYRLRFGFDQMYAMPRTIHLHRVGDAHRFELKFDLPAPEARVLGLSWRDAADGIDRYIDDFGIPILEDVAALLGIRVVPG